MNRVAHTEECPLSEHHEISGDTRLGEGSVPEGARFHCLRPPGRVWKVEGPSLRTGQKWSSESEGGILQEGSGLEQTVDFGENLHLILRTQMEYDARTRVCEARGR
jgi:hypothetical protein